MPISESRRRNNDKYNMKCDYISLRPLKPIGEKIRLFAKNSGNSLQGYILDAVNNRISEEENGKEFPPEKLSALIDWLKEHGHSDTEILDCIHRLSEE